MDIENVEYDEFKIYSNNIKNFESFLLDLLDNKQERDVMQKSTKFIVLIEDIISLLKYLDIEPICFPIGFLYLKKIKEKRYKILLEDLKLLLLISMLESIKMYDDYGILNIEYGKFCKIDLNIVNSSEEIFLKNISYELFVKPEEYEEFLNKLGISVC
jgi:hypothetical protein